MSNQELDGKGCLGVLIGTPIFWGLSVLVGLGFGTLMEMKIPVDSFPPVPVMLGGGYVFFIALLAYFGNKPDDPPTSGK